ncbi:peptidoglycan DD-metalloendopeptidase family protein [Pseudooceanicola sp. LIPI14-2-Ac024]|uniref:peptidoglycan DD-metalloendopeptidase family protein n=1 Tax=Pseudooceanicola sp. LIPI14-2-Ac024 TaxID=3344875 RepID=UPI0035D00FA8
MIVTYRTATRGIAASLIALAAGCTTPLDYDLRGNFDQFSTAEAARMATAPRPQPDNRGVISYPNYQVAVARNGDTVASIATRVGIDAQTLARHNGLRPEDQLRRDEVLSLPARVAEPSPATGAIGTGPIRPAGPGTDITSVAGSAIDRAGAGSVQTTTLAPAQTAAPAPVAPQAQTGTEPTRHKVQRGETAFTVSRLYGVPIELLGEWNGLDSNYTIREGQFLLIPVAAQTGSRSAAAPAPRATTEAPGTGSATPVPPSAARPLPAEKTVPQAKAVAETPKAPDIGQAEAAAAASAAAMAFPVKGSIIREYAKGRNDGIDIQASPGTAVGAAEAGEVAAITSDAEGNHVVVIRHDNKLLTIYSNVSGIAVKEKQKVSRGQKIAAIPASGSPYVHFEVRKGLESTDPMPYLQ